MLIVVSLLLLTMALSAVMLLVLSSLRKSGARGIREWSAANALAVVSLPLFAARGVAPDFLSIEVANTLLLGTTVLMLAGFRRHLDLDLPCHRLAACVGLGLAAILALHHGVDSVGGRVVAMSLLHGALLAEMGVVVWRQLARTGRRYPALFTVCAAFLNAAVQLVRALVYGAQAAGVQLPWEDATVSMVFFSAGALSLPALTLGAVMMANAELIARARHAADHDHLTGARSRRAFFDLATREQARALRREARLSLLLFDVDHFKRINDTHGHAAGDRVLVDIVERTCAVVRSIDTVARLGGEEFAVLLPDTGADTALLVAERLRHALEHVLELPSGLPVGYTVSIGVATLGAGESIDAMLSRADAALYAAKASGRNAAVDARELPAKMA
ncbi:sensor domain-containing diguanylate cyclase [Massilia aerilata]|uniref:diguanylate cyclase n=1 Tax=Massilia aerilata TaxID=453817 RepID=A0ABW0RXG3_9BURK